MKEKKGIHKAIGVMLRTMQHICFACLAVCLVIVIIGTGVRIDGLHGADYYNLLSFDTGNAFQDTVLTNTIMGRDVSDILRYATIADQLETNGKYDPEKSIDIVGYNYRDADLPDQYITANYYLEDLLKWGKFGVETEPFNNRYKTVDGKTVEEIVNTQEEYDSMINHIEKASSDLYTNYKEYLVYKNYYTAEKSNLRYCIVKEEEGATFLTTKKTYFTNMEELSKGTEKPEDVFRDMMSYIEYCPSTLTYDTNTSISEQTFRNMEMRYSYAYPDNVQIWIGVMDPIETDIYDEFFQARIVYDRFYGILYPCIYMAIFAACLYGIILIYLTIKEGRVYGKKNNGRSVLTRFDLISSEVYFVLCVAFVAAVGALMAVYGEVCISDFSGLLQNLDENYVAVAVVAYFVDIILLYLYYSFVRRCKTGVIWRNSIVVKACSSLVDYCKKIFLNGPVAVRVLVPFFLLVFMNLLAPVILEPAVTCAILIDFLVAGILFEEALRRAEIVKGIRKISDGDFTYRADVSKLHGSNRELGDAVNSIGDGIKVAVETSMKDERMKADLITNVSHDIKTPLTSIINYVDLLKRERIENDKVNSYIRVLDEKSQRLKQLTDDLVEASKISSGNIVLKFEKINLVELINQSVAEFDDKFEEKGLRVVLNNRTTSPYVYADSRRTWRVIENLFTNIYKYSMEQTRVYVDLANSADTQNVILVMKNISANSLNCDPNELTDRFIRGDESRTTEGSGLGLSIAKNLVEIQNGHFEVQLDGDLFKILITFPVYTEELKPGIVTIDKEDSKQIEMTAKKEQNRQSKVSEEKETDKKISGKKKTDKPERDKEKAGKVETTENGSDTTEEMEF